MVENERCKVSRLADGVSRIYDFGGPGGLDVLQNELPDTILLWVALPGKEPVQILSGFSVNMSARQLSYPVSGEPLPAGSKVTIVRRLPLTQNMDIVNQQSFFPDRLEAAYDKLTMLVQQLYELQLRVVRSNIAMENLRDLPPGEPGKVLAWAQDCLGFVNAEGVPAPTAMRWDHLMKMIVDGDVSGEVSFDGSKGVTLTLEVNRAQEADRAVEADIVATPIGKKNGDVAVARMSNGKSRVLCAGNTFDGDIRTPAIYDEHYGKTGHIACTLGGDGNHVPAGYIPHATGNDQWRYAPAIGTIVSTVTNCYGSACKIMVSALPGGRHIATTHGRALGANVNASSITYGAGAVIEGGISVVGIGVDWATGVSDNLWTVANNRLTLTRVRNGANKAILATLDGGYMIVNTPLIPMEKGKGKLYFDGSGTVVCVASNVEPEGWAEYESVYLDMGDVSTVSNAMLSGNKVTYVGSKLEITPPTPPIKEEKLQRLKTEYLSKMDSLITDCEACEKLGEPFDVTKYDALKAEYSARKKEIEGE